MNINIFVEGFGIGASLIMAIGAQNAFVLKNGIKRKNVFFTALICSLTDLFLIALGALGLGTLINKTPILMIAATIFGVVFLTWYAVKAFSAVFKHQRLEEAKESDGSKTLKSTLFTLLALSFLNPHVYLDTVVLLGSIGARYPIHERVSFVVGACFASITWFFSLSYGAGVLAPLFKKEITWKILDFIIGCIMLVIVYKLIEFGISLKY